MNFLTTMKALSLNLKLTVKIKQAMINRQINSRYILFFYLIILNPDLMNFFIIFLNHSKLDFSSDLKQNEESASKKVRNESYKKFVLVFFFIIFILTISNSNVYIPSFHLRLKSYIIFTPFL